MPAGRSRSMNAVSARISSGSLVCGRIPSNRSARRTDRSFGHAPTTQMGMRGCWTGVGRKVIGPNR